MNEIIEFLKEKGFTPYNDWNEPWCQTFTKTIEELKFLFRVVLKDDGSIVFEANANLTMDRWGNCDYSYTFKSKQDFFEHWSYCVNYEMDGEDNG